MRKLFSIVFVILLLFNFLGYYGLFLGLRYQNTQSLILRLDADDYKSSQTVTIKIPFTVPYATDSREFERIDGEFEHNGEFYRLVKQRLYRDTLSIVCVKDHESKRIMQALSSYVKTFTDKPVDTNQSTAKIISRFSKDYISTSFELSTSAEGWRFSFAFCDIQDPVLLLQLPILSPPPEA